MKIPKKKFTVQDYQNQIMEMQSKIQELQSKCNHLEWDVCFYMWRPGAMNPAHICKSCNVYIRAASEEESKKLWDEWHKNNQQTVSFGNSTFTNLAKND